MFPSAILPVHPSLTSRRPPPSPSMPPFLFLHWLARSRIVGTGTMFPAPYHSRRCHLLPSWRPLHAPARTGPQPPRGCRRPLLRPRPSQPPSTPVADVAPTDSSCVSASAADGSASTCRVIRSNRTKKDNFVYKHSRGNGFFKVGEPDYKDYYHLNFHAQDKSGHSQLFFGEIEAHPHPTVKNVTCCCAVSPSDAGGRGIPTAEEALKALDEYIVSETMSMDNDHCYACFPTFKHPKGECYNGGHFADTLQYRSF